MCAYPGYFGLPDWEPVVLILENHLTCDLLCPDDYEVRHWPTLVLLRGGQTVVGWEGAELQIAFGEL